MKYIRTKETICFAIDDKEVDYFKYQLGVENIKIADTIEELCDDVVIKNQNENPYILYILYGDESEKKFKYVKDRLEYLKECEIYGAIWTDKGLIYVAKMNDKGELELI